MPTSDQETWDRENLVVLQVTMRFPDRIYQNTRTEMLDLPFTLPLIDRVNLQFESLRHELVEQLKREGKL